MKLHKKFGLCLLATVAMLLCLLVWPQTAHAASTSDLTFTLDATGDGYIVSDCDEDAVGELWISATYKGKPVTGISDYAFRNCKYLTSITLPEGVTSIGNGAFENCSKLTSFTIPGSVTSMGDGAFSSCDNLISVTIPNGITSIGKEVFSGCTRLSSITIPDSVTSIGEKAFENCTLLADITIPDNVTSIGIYAFYDCDNLINITIPEGVSSISRGMFNDCDRLTSVTIPDSVTSIGDRAFQNCDSLTSITIPGSVTSIGNEAFYSCYRLTSVTIGNGVTAIGWDAYNSCFNLASITIPNSVTSIGGGAFQNCDSLTSIIIPDSITTILDYTFSFCDRLTSVAIPNSVTSIAAFAFNSSAGLDTVTYCGTQEEWDSIEIDGANEPLINAALQLHNYENCVCAVCGAIAHTWSEATCTAPKTCSTCGATEGSALGHDMQEISAEVPAGCETTGKTAVYTCANGCGHTEGGEEIPALGHNFENGICTICGEIGILASGTCGENLTWELLGDGTLIIDGSGKMKDYYFHFMNQYEPDPPPWYDIRALVKNVIIRSGVTRIGHYAFYGCSNLESITMPASIESIGICAFTGCQNMLAVYITDLTAWCNIDFEYNYYPEGPAGPNAHPLKWGGKLYLNGEQVKDLVIPDGVAAIKDYAFYFGSFNSITIPSSVQTIGVCAFYDCNMKSIVIPNSVTNIGSGAFESCGGLTKITYCGTQSQWGAIANNFNNVLNKATLQFHNFESGVCSLCGQKELAAGDIDGNDEVTYNDAVYLLLHTMFGEEAYPLNGAEGDIDCNGTVNEDDAVYLLLHTLFGDMFYPLNTPALPSSKEELIG